MKQVTPASPHVIVMVGIPGAGKTTFAERFSETFSTPYINRSFLEHEFDINVKKSHALAVSLLDEIAKTKRTIIYEGDTSTIAKRQEIIKRILSKGYRPLLVWVQTEPGEAKRRATKLYPKGSGLSSNEFDDLESSFEAPKRNEHAVVISGKHTYATQVKVILRQLASERPTIKTPPRTAAPRNGRMLIQ